MLRIFMAAALAVSSLLAQPAPGQTSLATNAPANTTLSTRVVAYTIAARVDVKKKTVDASETLTYRNLTDKPLSTFPFHLYLNAFQPTSTFTTETHFGGGIRDSDFVSDYPAKKLGSIAITHLEADGFGDLTQKLHFISPDDNNAADRTVAMLTLPRAVAPGDSITFHMTFHDQFPESVARNGYKRDFLMGGQWFPKVGVFWNGKWNCHQYHSTTEFFADFGTYNVSLTLPRNYTVGASGVPTGDHANLDGTRTLSFYGEDIHDFAWAASPHFTVTTGTYLSALGPVQVRVLALREHPRAGQRYLNILMDSLKQFDARYGPYPYKVLTLIDPEPGSEMEGMEYPTLITGGTSWFAPTYDTEITAEHEFGHQYWYGMVATNEFEEAWLDEGINSYTEVNVTGDLLGRDTSSIKLPWANLSDMSQQYLGYLSSRDFDPVTRHAWEFHNAESYGGVTYGKSAVLLKTLEGIIGQDTMDEALRVYFMRFRFTHPTTEDFLRTIEEVAIRRGRATPVFGNPSGPGRIAGLAEAGFRPDLAAALTQPEQPKIIVGSSLRPYFEQAVYGTRVLDYAVDDISSEPLQWWLPASSDKHIRDSVTIRRIGDFMLPVTLEVVFDDGSRIREYWDPGAGGRDGNDRWKTFTYVRTAEIVSAEIDPDHKVLLDVDHFNDSRVVEANRVPARKLTSLWVWAMQLGSQLAGWLV
jgi:hypothetical protein